MNKIEHSVDVYFDELFESTLAFTHSRFPGYIDVVITDANPFEDLHVERTGSSLWFSNKIPLGKGEFIQTFAQPKVREDYDFDLAGHGGSGHDSFSESRFEEEETDSYNLKSTDYTYTPTKDDDNYNISTSHHSFFNLVPSILETTTAHPTSRYPTRNRQPPQRFRAYPASSQPLPIPDEYIDHVQSAYNAEVLQPLLDVTNMDPLAFLPAPNNWKDIIKLPHTFKVFWAASLLKELKEVIKKGTFKIDTPTSDDPIIPVTAKFRVKLTTDGTIDKLKSRIALQGDLMRDNVQIPDTWCPIAGFRSFKIFLAMAAGWKQRIYQLGLFQEQHRSPSVPWDTIVAQQVIIW
jgi:hypothetical protein